MARVVAAQRWVAFAALLAAPACGETTADKPARVDAGPGDADADAAPEASVCKPLVGKEACCTVPTCFWLPASYAAGEVCLAQAESCGPAPAPASTPCAIGQKCFLRRYYLDQRGDCEPHPNDDVKYPVGVCVPQCPDGTIEYTMTNGNPGCKIEP
jgi:hypothetical protein